VKARAVVIHELAHARAALAAAAELDVSVALWSAPGAAAYAGAGWFDAVLRLVCGQQASTETEIVAVLDCGDRADLVQAAWRQGVSHVCFSGRSDVARRLAGIARHYGATLHRKRPLALDLLDCSDPVAACRDWLGGR
jgi:hypothetical protein